MWIRIRRSGVTLSLQMNALSNWAPGSTAIGYSGLIDEEINRRSNIFSQ
jgi:hypothetical protein